MELYGYGDPALVPDALEVDAPDGGGVLRVELRAAPFLPGDRDEDGFDEDTRTVITIADSLTDGDGEDVETTEAIREQIAEILSSEFGFDPTTSPDYSRDLLARIVASEWHGGQASALYAFSSSGAIREDLASEIQDLIDSANRRGDDEEVQRLTRLLEYARAEGERGPQPDWSELDW